MTTRKPVTFWVAVPPNIANPKRNVHWGQRARAKAKYQEAAALRIRAQIHPLPMFKHAAYRAHFYVPGIYDLDNLTTLLKWVQDTIVQVGMVPNDNPKHLELVEIPKQTTIRVRKRRGESPATYRVRKRLAGYRVEIEIWEKPRSERKTDRRAHSAASPD